MLARSVVLLRSQLKQSPQQAIVAHHSAGAPACQQHSRVRHLHLRSAGKVRPGSNLAQRQRGEADGQVVLPETRGFIDLLNRDFGNLRELLLASEPSVAEAILAPAIDRFAESLATVASTRPDLNAKCESLTSSLAKFLESRPSESTWDSGDSENPS